MSRLTLEKHLETLDNDHEKRLSILWAVAKMKYEKLLSNVKISFPTYSLHDKSHAQNVVENIEKLLGENGIKNLEITDTWMILECAYIHDLGMVINYDEIQSDWNSDSFSKYIEKLLGQKQGELYEAAKTITDHGEINITEHKTWPIDVIRATILLISEYYRPKHAKRTEKNYEKWIPQEQKEFINIRITRRIATIAALHTSPFESIMSLEDVDDGQFNDYIHPRFIAVLLRLGDVLDIDNNRFDNYLLKQLETQLPEATYLHKGKHESIREKLVKFDEIRIKADCPNEKIYFITNSWINWIKSEVDNAILHWKDIAPEGYPVLPRVDSRIMINERPILHGFEDIKYEFSQKKMFEMIRGSNIYDSDYVFIREYMQNALDSSKLKFWNDLNRGIVKLNKNPKDIQPWDLNADIMNSYRIDIFIIAKSIDENHVQVTFSIQDKGVGFSTKDVMRLARIGNSWRENDEMQTHISEMPNWLRPTGAFGIGMQSAFLVTNRVTVQTVNENNQGMKLILHSEEGGNEHILVVEDNIPNNCKTNISIDFEVNNEHLQKNNTIKFHNFLLYHSPFKYIDIAHYWELKLMNEALSCLANSFIPVHIATQEELADYDISGFYNRFTNGYTIEPCIFPGTEKSHEVLFEDENMRITADHYLNAASLWNKEKGIYLLYTFASKNYNTNASEVFFKEICVGNKYINTVSTNPFQYDGKCFNIKISLWGTNAEDCLLFNRTNLKSNYQSKLREIITQSTTVLLEKMYDTLISGTTINSNPLALYALYSQLCPQHITNDLMNAFRNCATGLEIGVIKRNQNNSYTIDSIPFQNLFDTNSDLYFANTGFEQYAIQNSRLSNELIDKANVPWFIYQQPYTYWLEDISKTQVYRLNNAYLNISIFNRIKKQETDTNPFDSLKEYKYTISHNDMDYPELQINALPPFYSLVLCSSAIFPHFIIIPRNALERLNSQCINDDNWLENILNELQYDGILEFIYNHQIGNKVFSINSIREAYKRLIIKGIGGNS